MFGETFPPSSESPQEDTVVDKFVQSMRRNILPIWNNFDIYPDNVSAESFLSLIEDEVLEEEEGDSVPVYPLLVHIRTHDTLDNLKQMKVIISQLDELASKHSGRRMPGTGDIYEPEDDYILSSTAGYIFRGEPITADEEDSN